jgi:hypothetical protein
VTAQQSGIGRDCTGRNTGIGSDTNSTRRTWPRKFNSRPRADLMPARHIRRRSARLFDIRHDPELLLQTPTAQTLTPVMIFIQQPTSDLNGAAKSRYDRL